MLSECLIGILAAEGEEVEKPGASASNMDEIRLDDTRRHTLALY